MSNINIMYMQVNHFRTNRESFFRGSAYMPVYMVCCVTSSMTSAFNFQPLTVWKGGDWKMCK